MNSKLFYEDMMDHALEIIIVFDNEGKIEFMNQCGQAELNYTRSDWQQKPYLFISNILSPYFQGNVGIEKIKEYEMDSVIETVAYRSNQTCFPVQLKVMKRIQDKERFICMALNTLKKSEMEKELLRAEEKAKVAQKIRNEFVANVTHELRTPVNGIKGHVRYMMDQEELTISQRQTMKIIESCCNNMEKIISNLLDFSKIEAGKFTLEVAEFDIRDCLKNIIETNIQLANEKGISLTYHIEEQIPHVLLGDELKIIQILNNLLSNAIKFTAIGYVKIEVMKILQVGNEIELFFWIADSGIGIAQEDRDKLFQSFSQVDASITRKYGGTGLGLAITKELVEMMRGQINVESQVGKGSTFSCSLFLNTKEEDTAEVVGLSIDKKKELLQKNAEELESINIKYLFGTKENKKELDSTMKKMVLCIELGTWERAEEFANNIRKLLEGADEDLKKKAFRLELTVRKEDYNGSIDLYGELKKLLPL